MAMAEFQNLQSFRLPPNFRGRSAPLVQLWWLAQATLFAWSPQFMYGWRRFVLRLFGAKIGRGVLVRPTSRVTYPWKLVIGDYSWIGDFVELYTLGPITIGAHCCVSQHSYLCAGSHFMNSPGFDIYAKPIDIEDEAWLCAGCFVHPGVRIGRAAVVGARSVILRDVEPRAVYAGVPARKIGNREQPRPVKSAAEEGDSQLAPTNLGGHDRLG